MTNIKDTAEGQQEPGLPLDEHAYRSIRRGLMEGLFAPGDRLSIRKVAAALNTSAMPARTALRRLAVEQALDVLPSGTAVVPRLTRDAFRELGAMRAALEPLAIQMAAPKVTKSVIQSLGKTIRDHQAARDRSDPVASSAADRQFLFTLYRLAEAPMLINFIETLWLRRGPIFWEARWALLGHGAVQHRHVEILAALQTKQIEAAVTILRSEIEAATEFLLSQIQFAGERQPRSGLSRLEPLQRARAPTGRQA